MTYTLGANVENLTLTGTTAINGTGNALDNVLTGNSANNTLTGGDGNDTLDGGAGTTRWSAGWATTPTLSTPPPTSSPKRQVRAPTRCYRA